MTDGVGGFGMRLRDRRLAAGLSQEELAERSGLSAHAISALERGHTRSPHRGSVDRLADALDLRGQARTDFIAAAGRRLSPPTGRTARTAAPEPDQPPAHRGRGQVVPRQLPAALPVFVGRHEQLAALSRLLEEPGSTTVLTAIGGTAGVGKTALAVHWAHQAAERFPDGQLVVNLRGFDPSAPPVAPADAIRAFLDALEVPPDRIPASMQAQVGLYRSLLVGKRMLVLLDNARNAAQVRPLLPGSPTCRTIVTSRNKLTGLTALDGAHPLPLDILTAAEARTLLTKTLGAARTTAEPAAADALIEACGYLPLALAVTAARAATTAHLPLSTLAGELADAGRRLDALHTADDPLASLRAALDCSYAHLTTDTARTFRLLGLHPGPDICAPATAALTALPRPTAARHLADLADATLITEHTPGRYSPHDLLRLYARELVHTQEDPAAGRAALTGLTDYYLRGATRASAILYSDGSRAGQAVAAQPGAPADDFEDADRARAWLHAERLNLAAIATSTADHELPAHAAGLSTALFRYLAFGGYRAEAIVVHQAAIRAAQANGDIPAEAHAVVNLAGTDMLQADYQRAKGHYQRALELCRQAEDRPGELRALASLGVVDYRQYRYAQAAPLLRQAAELSRELGDRSQEIRALSCLGQVEFSQGRYAQASRQFQQSITLARTSRDPALAEALVGLAEIETRQAKYAQAKAHLEDATTLCGQTGNQNTEAYARTLLAGIHLRTSRPREALALLREQLATCRQTGSVPAEIHVLRELGAAEAFLGEHQQAEKHLRQALDTCRDSGERQDEAGVLNGLGDLRFAAGQLDQAQNAYTEALAASERLTDLGERAHAHHGFGNVFRATGDSTRARRHWEHALAIYTDLAVPQADQIRACLTDLGNHP